MDALNPAVFEEGSVANGNLNLHYLAAGPHDGEPVLLLHGFPQYSYMWRNQIPALAEAGFRVIAPDLRGYHLSDRPKEREAYRMENLLSDVGAFYKAFGWQRANLVGHDWGAAIAWLWAANQPDQVSRLAAIDVPYPAAFRQALNFRNPEQLARSLYIGFFQMPVLPERLGQAFVEQFVQLIFGTAVRKNAFSPTDLRIYRDMLAEPGQLEAGINYYRANANIFGSPLPGSSRPKNSFDLDRPLDMPVALIYGDSDQAFSKAVWRYTADYCRGYYRSFELKGTGHWAPEEAPQTVSRLLVEHLRVAL